MGRDSVEYRPVQPLEPHSQRLQQRHPLLPGDKISLGQSITLRFMLPPALASATVVEADLFPTGEPEMNADVEPAPVS